MSGKKLAKHDPPKGANGFYTELAPELPLLKGQHRCRHTGAHLEAQQTYDDQIGVITETMMVLDPDPADGRRTHLQMLWHDVHRLVREWTEYRERTNAAAREALSKSTLEAIGVKVTPKGSPANPHVIPTPVAKTDAENGA